MVDAATSIRSCVGRVAQLRELHSSDERLGSSVKAIKRLQARRFAGTYTDLLEGGTYELAATFFLEELYGDKDFADRDAQFAVIAGTLQRLFPAQVVGLAVKLAELHALTEELDDLLAHAWLVEGQEQETSRYLLAWRQVGRREQRDMQLRSVIVIGEELSHLTRLPGLRMMLRMMRAPAAGAGLGSLQRFLERGFDIFGGLARSAGGAAGFLNLVGEREAALVALLFDGDLVASETQLNAILGQAR